MMVATIQQLPPQDRTNEAEAYRKDFAPFSEFSAVSDAIGIVAGVKDARLLAMPAEPQLGSLRDGRLRVVSPIPVVFFTEDDHHIVEAPELSEFGFGDNPSEAMADLQRAIAELYFTLEADQDHLGKDLQALWEDLKTRIHKR